MNVLCCQFDIAWENKAANHAKVEALLERAGAQKGALALLPEMFATGFSMNVDAIDDTPTRATWNFLSKTAAKHEIHLMGGLVTRGADGRGENVAVVFGPDGREMARYQKLHPFTFGGESQRYLPGGQIATFGCAGFTVCPFICYDLRFPEVFRIAASRGANLFTVIANWPEAREQHWLTLLAARAIENQAYVAAVNRIGRDKTLSYSGRSIIIDPRGQILADAGGAEMVIGARLDREWLEAYRQGFPALADMRCEFQMKSRPGAETAQS